MTTWKRDGDEIIGEVDRQEAAVLRGLVSQIEGLFRARAAQAPQDELAELTGIRTGPSTAPDDPILARLLPDFHRVDTEPDLDDSAAALRSVHEPELIDHKTGVIAVVLDTCPAEGGQVRLTLEQADAWLGAINDVRLAIGTAIEITEDSADVLPDDDPRAPHLGVYHWLTVVLESMLDVMAPA